MYGNRYNAQKSLELQMINKIYKDRKEMMDQVKSFSTEFSPKGKFRESVKDMKLNMYSDVYNKLISNPVSLQCLRRVAAMK